MALFGGVLAGCAGLGSPSGGAGSGSPRAGPGSTPPVPAAIAQAQRTHELPSPPPPPEHVTRTASSAAAALRAYAGRYINWDAGTVTGVLQSLAAVSVGQARSAMELEAAQVASDPELQQAGIANSGTVESVAPLTGSSTRFVVVTLERTTAAFSTEYEGLRPAWHVTVAAVTEVTSGRWVVSGWQPEN